MNILLIAGHGQGDSGAVANGYKEAELTREIVNSIYEKLKLYANVDIFDINKNMYKYLQKNSFDFKKYDYVFEVHFNAGTNDLTDSTTGTEILIHPKETGRSVEENILNNISALGFKNRGIKERTNLKNMNICKGVQGVSYCLLEVCFIDDKDDMKLYQEKKEKISQAICDGIVYGFGLIKSNDYIINELTTVNDIVWELSERGIISDKNLWLKKLDSDINSYWLARKCINYIKENVR